MEADMLPKVDKVIAVSQTLVTRVNQLGRSAKLLTHGVDLDHWRRPAPPGLPPEFLGLQPPYILFWGVIDRRMDTQWVRLLGKSMGEGSMVFVGPQEAPDPELEKAPRVTFRPSVPYARLPELAAWANVLIMPYADLPVTRAIQPLKLKEYLATGKPTVVRELPATKEWDQSCDVCRTPDGFAAVVLERIKTGISPAQRLDRQRLFAEGWDAKAKQFEQWVDGEQKSPIK
jgi:glycosyltransferase involved in cell wall biosynthesis